MIGRHRGKVQDITAQTFFTCDTGAAAVIPSQIPQMPTVINAIRKKPVAAYSGQPLPPKPSAAPRGARGRWTKHRHAAARWAVDPGERRLLRRILCAGFPRLVRQTAARLTVPEMYVFTYWKNPYHRTAGMEPLSVAACF